MPTTLEEEIKKVEEEFEKKFCGELGIGNWTQSWADEIKTLYRSSLTSIYEKGRREAEMQDDLNCIKCCNEIHNAALDAVKEGMELKARRKGYNAIRDEALELIESLRK